MAANRNRKAESKTKAERTTFNIQPNIIFFEFFCSLCFFFLSFFVFFFFLSRFSFYFFTARASHLRGRGANLPLTFSALFSRTKRKSSLAHTRAQSHAHTPEILSQSKNSILFYFFSSKTEKRNYGTLTTKILFFFG